MKKWKAGLRIFTIAIAAAALLAAMWGPAQARKGRTAIDALDEVYFDGSTLKVTYTVLSVCRTDDHEAAVEFDADKVSSGGKKKITGLTVLIYDISDEAACSSRKTDVLVSAEFDLSSLVDAEIADLKMSGWTVPDDYTVTLPPMRPPIPNSGYKKPPSTGGTTSGGIGSTKTPVKKMKVTYVEYTGGLSCTMYKNDGSTRDGFTAEAASFGDVSAALKRSCQATNDPDCSKYLLDPDHTKCDPLPAAKESFKEFDSNALPAEAKTESWTCILRKNDGSRKDGFSGTADTEDEARAIAAQDCYRTNHPLCSDYSKDNDHTTCTPRIVVEGPKPTALWGCSLWKNDGSRKDGFKGTGGTMSEAISDAISSCARTNHPSCSAFGRDPAHTSCDVQFVYPDK